MITGPRVVCNMKNKPEDTHQNQDVEVKLGVNELIYFAHGKKCPENSTRVNKITVRELRSKTKIYSQRRQINEGCGSNT